MQSKYPSVSLFTDHDQLTENLRLLVADSHIAICWFSMTKIVTLCDPAFLKQ
jgi:hypothetical protein